MAVVKNLMIRGGADFSNIYKQTNKLKNNMSGLNSSLSGMFKGLKQIAGITTAAIVIKKVSEAIASCTKSAIAVESSMYQLNRLLGDNAGEFKKWANSQATAYGMSKSEAYKYGATFSNLVSNFSRDTAEATGYTEQLLKASAVIASSTGRTFEDVSERIRSGMLGSTEAIEDLGVYTQVSMLQSTEAFKKYANGKSWAQLDYNTQQQIRLLAILEQAQKKYGDALANTTASEQQKFVAKLQNVKLNLGQVFLPIYQSVLPALQTMADWLSRVTSLMAQFSQALFGKSVAKEADKTTSNINKAATATNNLGNAVSSTAKKIRDLAGFDEINNIGRPDNNNSGDGTTTTAAGAGGGISLMPTVNTEEAETTFSALADKIRTWLKSIDFGPIQDSFNRLKEAADPVITIIGGNIKWFLTEILKPLAEWTVQDAVPAFLNLVAGALDFLNPLLQTFQPAGEWLWNNFLQPIASWTGEIIVDVLNGLGETLSKIGDWIAGHKILVEDFAIVLGSVAAAFGLVKLAIVLPTALLTAWNVIAGIGTAVTTALGAAFAFITSPIGIVVAAIGAVIAIVVLCIKHWDDIKKVAINVWDKIKEIAGNIKDKFTDAFSIIKTKWENFKTSISNGISTVISKFKDFGTKVGDFFSNAFKSVVNGALSWIESKINGFISSINGAISFINKIPGVNIGKLSYVSLPRLAKGGIVDSATIAMIGERGKEAVVPLERNTEWIDKMAEKLAKNIVINNSTGGDRDLYLELHVGDTKLGRACIKAINKVHDQEGKILLEL